MSKILSKWLSSDSVVERVLAASTFASDGGLEGGSGNKVGIKLDTTGGANIARALSLGTNGLGIKVDSSIVEDGSGQLSVDFDNVADGATYGRVLLADLTSGHVNKVSDGTTTVGAADIATKVDSGTAGNLVSLTADGNIADSSLSLNDSGTNNTELWSAQKINNSIVNALDGVFWKDEVRAATASNISLSGAQTIDNIALVAGDRVLVRAQTNAAENGIYVVASGAWTRSSDVNTPAEMTNHAVLVIEGDNFATAGYLQTATVTAIGTDPVTYVQFNGAGQIDAGIGLSRTGNTIHCNLGAGIKELPTDEIGLDLANNSGLTLTNELAAGQLMIKVDNVTGATVVPVNLSNNGAGVLVDDSSLHNNSGTLEVKDSGIKAGHIDFGTGASQVSASDLPADYSASNYTASTSDVRGHLAGIDAAILGISTENKFQVVHTITAAEETAGYVDISSGWTIPANAQSVEVNVVGGPQQVNYACSTAGADFEIGLNSGSERIIFNASGSPTGILSNVLEAGDRIIVTYIA